MKLFDTIPLMQSDSYGDRMVAEYWQTKIRYERLRRIIVKQHAGTLNYQNKCGVCELESQARAMDEYLRLLELRAEIERIDLKLPEY